jgi:tetrahydromethanopterin S-methyltransferase subunit G
MEQQTPPIKPRIIKTTVQKETDKPPGNGVLTAQYQAIMEHVLNIERIVDYMVSQPQKLPQKVNSESKTPSKEEFIKSIPVWQQPEKQRTEKVKTEKPKRKGGKGLIIAFVVCMVLILLTAYFLWSFSQGYVFFWNS